VKIIEIKIKIAIFKKSNGIDVKIAWSKRLNSDIISP